MKLPNTFRPEKNLDDKTRQLIDKKNVHYKNVKRISISFRYGDQEYTLDFFKSDDLFIPTENDDNLALFLIHKGKMKKGPASEKTEQLISQLLDRYSGEAVRANTFINDENLTGWEIETPEKFDPEIIMHDIKNHFAEKYDDIKVAHMEQH